jgi:hypothetical protein
MEAWKQIAWALANSDNRDDHVLAKKVVDFVKAMPMLRREVVPPREMQRPVVQPEHVRRGPEIER